MAKETNQNLATKPSLAQVVNCLGLYLAALFAAYGIVYLKACPSPALATAVAAEVIAFGVGMIVWKANFFKIPNSIVTKLPEVVTAFIQNTRTVVTRTKFVILLSVAMLITLDFGALASCLCGAYPIGSSLYSVMPCSFWAGLHPAFSLELLTGALVTHRNYERAEPLYYTLLSIRKNVCGPSSDLVGAFYADLGDFYVRQSQLEIAEGWYRKSVALGPRTGRAFTALATVLREQGKLEESRVYYVKALSLREKSFGSGSKQYADTLRGYRQLQDKLCAKKSPTSLTKI